MTQSIYQDYCGASSVRWGRTKHIQVGLNNVGLRKVSAVFSAVFGYDCETDVERDLNAVYTRMTFLGM